LLDLGKLFKVGKEGNEELESIEVALSTAVSLIRKKAGWGLELGNYLPCKITQPNTSLDENAVDLTHSLIGLQNNYEIEDFDHKVLEALTALVVCSPRKAALWV
jgi:telomere length regulation protein